MKKGWKIFWVVVVVLSAIGAIAFFWGKGVWDKITFDIPRLVGLNFNGLTAADIAAIAVAGGTKEVTATVQMDVSNQNNFPIPFSNLKVVLKYNGDTIAQTSNLLAAGQKVPANGTLSVQDTVSVILSGAGGQMLLEKLKGNKVTIEYSVQVRIFGIPLPKGLQTQTFEF